MDSSSQPAPIQPLIPIWELLRNPIVAFYQEGMNRQNLTKILAVIDNSVHHKKFWFIPFTKEKGHLDQETQHLLEEQHTAFCTWLLGRLFCILGRESLVDTHASCIKAQIGIVTICAENECMLRCLFTEYISCLSDLIILHSSGIFLSGGSHLLRRFTPLPVKGLENLNLSPKYILIKSQDLVSLLEKYLLQIIDSVLPSILFLFQDLLDKCWSSLNQLIQVCNTELRISILKTFSKIISTAGCNNSFALAELIQTLKFVAQNSVPHAPTNTESFLKQDLLSSLGELVNVILSSGCCTESCLQKDLLTILHSVLTHWDASENNACDFENVCDNVAVLIRTLPPGLVNQDKFCFLLKEFETQQGAVKILSQCVFGQVVEYITSTNEYHSSLQKNLSSEKHSNMIPLIQIDATLSLPMWAPLLSDLFEGTESIHSNFPDQPSKQFFKEMRNVVGKMQALLACAIEADMRYSGSAEARSLRVHLLFFRDKMDSMVSFLNFLIKKFVFLKMNDATVCFPEVIVKSMVITVGYLFLLYESESLSEEDKELAFVIAAIPWLDHQSDAKLNVKLEFVHLVSNFPEVKSEEMRTISIRSICNISLCEAWPWKQSVFSKIICLLQDPYSHKLVAEVVKAMPSLILENYSEMNHMLCGVLPSIIESKSETLLTAVAMTFPTIVCVLSGNVVPVSFLGEDGLLERRFICLTCQKDYPGTPCDAKNVLTEYKDALCKFMALLSSPVVAVRQILASSLGTLVLHLPAMYQPETVNTLMKYSEDEDRHVRLTFSKMLKFLIFSREWIEGKGIESQHLQEEHIPLTQVDRVELSHSRPRLERVLQMLLSALLSRLCKHNDIDSDVQETLLATIVDIGCVPLDCVLLPVLQICLICVSHPMFSNPSLGQVYLERIAVAHNTTVTNLYYRFQSDLCQVLVSGMGMNFHAKSTFTTVMDKVVFCLGFESVTTWLMISLSSILPSLVVFVVKYKDTAFLAEVLSLLSTPPATLFKENFQFIYPYAFINESDEVVENCVKLLEELSGTSADQLITISSKTIHSELLLHYHSKKERVEEGICQLINVLERKNNKPQKLDSPPKREDIAKHLEQRFLGVLVHFDSLLESSIEEEKNKMKALQSIPEIIRLLGPKYITPIRFKVLSTLRTALRLTHCDFPNLSCSAWKAFIQSVDIHELGPLLGSLAASVLPLVDQFPDEIASLLEWLVVRHEHELSEYIPDLFFLPDSEALHNVFKIVQNHVQRKLLVLNNSQKLSDYLQQPLRFIGHDNVDMRKHGLEYLLSLLKEKQRQFTLSLLQEEVVDDNVAKLLTLLIEGCRDTDEDIPQLCVESLGVLGALDPGHLPLKKPGIGIPQIYSVFEDRYAVQALTILAKAYQAARHTRYLDSFAVAIQELLKCYNISSQSTSNKKSLWGCFPPKIQQVMAPLENSSYYMTSLQPKSVWPHPLFGTRHASSLTNWATNWACRLVKFIEEGQVKDMFTVCIPSLARDINCVLFFLPFIVLYAVLYGQEDQHKMIAEEMTYIIQQHLKTDEREVDDVTSDVQYQVLLNRPVPEVKTEDFDSATHVLCAKTVFTLLDFMEKWVGLSKKRTEASRKDIEPNLSMNLPSVQRFLSQFSKLDLAHGNYGVNEYARSLMYLEDHLMEHKELIKDEDHLSFLERIYAQLNEPDGIRGVLAIQCTQPKLLDAIVFHEVSGQHQEALACLELLAKEHTNDAVGMRIQQAIIRCCLSLDQPYAALKVAEGALAQTPECRSAFLEAQAECFWRMNSFDKLKVVLEDPKLDDSTAWGVSIGRCLMDIRSNDHVSLQKHLQATRSFLSKELSTASLETGSYLQGYPHVIKLHMLQEVQEASKVIARIQSADVSEDTCVEVFNNLVQLWSDRLELVQATASVQEPLLRLRRCLLELASGFVKESNHSILSLLGQQLGASWLKSAEVARIAECNHQAYIYLLNAEKYKPKRHFIELAKLHWVKHEEDHALATLRRGLDEHFPNSKEFKDMAADNCVEDRKICAEAKLLIACYNDRSMNVDTDVNVSNYKEAAEIYMRWEKSWAYLAEYYDRLSSTDESRLSGKYQAYAISTYARSLRYGCSFIYHSMSRLLTIWLDYGSKYYKALSSKEQFPARELAERKKNLVDMNAYITSSLEILPTYMFMTGFSQLVSRICHPLADVFNVIKSIIVKLLTYYQQQTLWMLLAVNRSNHALRKCRSQGVLDDPQVRRIPDLARLIGDFSKVGDLLSELCQKPVPKELQKTNVSAISRNLPKIFKDPSFSKIMMPLQNCRTLLLPQKEISSVASHDPFPLHVPSIAEIKEEVIILGSLQRPRKITFRGDDGVLYDMMCKDKDDLRLDARVMEFNSIVNKYLQKAPASRSRRLNIRTYSVVPLNEDCGLIEWVPNLSAFRIIVTQFYREMGCFMSSKELKKYLLDKDATLQQKRENFQQLRDKHPPVFQNWFRNNFSDTRSWFEARKSYVRTTAVMSMVGFILGLGDRHGENILLDTTCGDVVHVDFNCLFNKGERFDCPERVPFRLTHNMVSAMGPTNVEGTFRIACEITLRLLRDEKETLLSVLRPFVYDPKQDELHALRRIMPKKNQNPQPQEEITNDLAVENVKNIDQRLSGGVKSGQHKSSQQLSVEGQTHVLIQEAGSIDNLCQMYIGWGAYL